MTRSRARLRRPTLGAALVFGASLLGGLAMLAASPSAQAEPPTGTDFTIQYWTTNSDGSRGRQMTANDLRGYVNKARCECGQAVSARVRLQPSEARDSVPVRTYVGNLCDQGQSGNNIQARPCALAVDDFTNTYTRNIDFEFNPLWLATGVTRDTPTRSIDGAEAAMGCDSQTGDGGIWICVENLEQTDCQPAEFVVTGQQTEVTDADGNTPSLTYDFLPPGVNASNFRAQGGDGSVVIKWDNTTTTDIQGYRALCANADGSPVDGKGFTLSSVTAQNNGTMYFTAENLCPDGPFDQVDVTEDPDPVLPDGGTGTGTGGGETGDFGSTGAAGFGAAPDVARGGGEDCCMAGGGCSDNTCFAAVVSEDGSCVDDWSDQCATLANDFCEVCGGEGNCCAANTSPSCADQACTVTVCAEEDFAYCCTQPWDAECANRAKELCTDVCDEGTTGGMGTSTTGMPATTSVTATGTSRGTGTGTDTDTDTATDTAGLDTSGIESLGWEYVCSGFIAANASTARINGLQNDQDYQVLLVAFDYAGNPVAASEVFVATPRETTDLWEACDAQDELCGKGGFCSCTSGPTPDGTAWFLLTGVLGLFARRPRRRRGAA